MSRIKEALFSEKGIQIVNFIFILALLIPNRGIIFAAYAVWIIYLAYCVKHPSSDSALSVYKGLIVFAVLMICLNLYFMLWSMQ